MLSSTGEDDSWPILNRRCRLLPGFVCLSLLQRPMAADFLALCNRFAHRIGLRDFDLDRTVGLAKDFVVVGHISTRKLSRL